MYKMDKSQNVCVRLKKAQNKQQKSEETCVCVCVSWLHNTHKLLFFL